MTNKRPALGRGLSALIPDVPEPREARTEIDIDRLSPNPRQPRAEIDDAGLEELARSIRSNGVIQPIVVRQRGDAYQIVAGERRWRAAQRAGMLRLPVVIRDVPDEKILELALIENVQRENLNPLEEAAAYQQLMDDHGLTQEQIAAAVGKDRSSVANHLRLLKLPAEIQAGVAAGSLSMGHARALLALADEATQRGAARDVITRGLSVRDTEALVRSLAERKTPTEPRVAPPTDANTRAAEERLRFALGTRVRIVRRGKGGRLIVDFTSEEELQRIYEHLTGR